LYNLTVLAIDQGTPQQTGSTVVLVNVTDVNDELPTFIQKSQNQNILENATQGTIVANCSAKDSDSNPKLRFDFLRIEASNYDGIAINATLVKVKICHLSLMYK